MIIDFNLPVLGDNIPSADITKVLVKAGDKVEKDDVLVEIETDKATVEIPSDVSGTIVNVYAKEGLKALVGLPLFTIDVSAQRMVVFNPPTGETLHNEVIESKLVASTPEQPISKKQTTGSYQFTIPVLGDNISSAQITKVLVKAGDKVEADQIVLEIETDKATVEVPTEVGGIVKEVKVKDGDKVEIGAVALVIESSELKTENKGNLAQSTESKVENKSALVDKPSTGNQPLTTSYPQAPKEHTHMPQVVSLPRDISKVVVPAAPSVRRFAREIGIEIGEVRGTGKNGRISIDDVKTYSKAVNQQIKKGGFAAAATFGVTKETLPDFSKWGLVETVPMSNIRRKTAEHLSYAWTTVPHVTQFDNADITELEKLRKQFGKQVEAAGGKLTVTGILLKVIASAMKVFPQFNSSVDMEKSEVIYKKYCNLGIAVDTDRGLLVPVIRDVDKKNITQISIDLNEVSKKARDKKLSLEDMQGGCFTISNLGGIGGTYFTPIVNTPEVAILGVSKSSFEPVYIDGKFEPRLMMPLSLSYDHRIIDGADAIRFLRWVINALENPFLLAL